MTKENNFTGGIEMKGITNFIQKVGKAMGNVIGLLLASGQDTIEMVITVLLPFIAFIAAIIGIVNATGIGNVIAKAVVPLASSLPGLLLLAALASFPILSPILGPGAVIAQIVGTFVGVEIGKGNIAPSMAIPGIFAINAQVGCDFYPVAIAMQDAEPETVEIGTTAGLLARQVTGPLGVLVGWLFSFGAY